MLKAIFLGNSSDPELNRKAVILNKIVWIILATITLSFFINMFIQPENIARYILIISILWPVSIALLLFAKKGYIYFSAFLYVTFLLLMIFGFSWTGGGIKGHGIKLLPIVVLLAGLTLGKKEIWLFGTIAVLGGLGLALADYYHQIPVREPLGSSPFVYSIYNITAIVLLCFLENISVETLRKALGETQKELMLRKQSEEKYRRIFESFQDIYYQTDMEGNINIITPSVKARMGYDPSDMIGKKATYFYNNTEQRDSFLSELKMKGSVLNYELDMMSKDGNIINIIVSSHILYDNKGNSIAIEGTIHDITQRKKAEEMLKLKNEKLLEIAFLQSHMVRRPVASVLGLISLINKDNPNDPENFEVIPLLEAASKELDDVIKHVIHQINEIQQFE